MKKRPAIKIQHLELRNIPVHTRGLQEFLFKHILDFIDTHPGYFIHPGEIKHLFHNSLPKYSTVQLSAGQGVLQITSFGKKEIRAVNAWWKAYRKINRLKDHNTIKCIEKYQLLYLDEPATYRITKFLINRKKNTSLNQLRTQPDEFHNEIAKYLVSNFLPLYNLLNHTHDKQQYDVMPEITFVKEHASKFPVFKGQYRYGYDIVFKTRLLLPRFFRMGESTALGYGEVTKL